MPSPPCESSSGVIGRSRFRLSVDERIDAADRLRSLISIERHRLGTIKIVDADDMWEV